MNVGLFIVGFNGLLPAANSLPVLFNGGAPMTNDGSICVSESAPQVFCHGLGYRHDGRICVEFAGTAHHYSRGGIPMTFDGRVVVSSAQPIGGYTHGLPVDNRGRVALANRPV